MENNTFNTSLTDTYIMYLRKSRKDIELMSDSDEDILKRHERILYKVADSLGIQKNQIIVKREVVSGDSIFSRPVIQEVLQMIEDENIKGVLVVEVERLARGDTKDQGIIAESFKFTDTKIITPQKIYDPNNEYDEEYFEFGLFMSRREFKTIKKRLKRGKMAAAQEGKFVGSTPPYGYDKVKLKGEKGWILVKNEKEAEAVKIMYELFLNQEYSPGEICTYLKDMGIKPRIAEFWSPAIIKKILKNPHNMGYIRYNNRIEVKKIENGNVVKLRLQQNVPNEIILVKGRHEPIIDENTFNKTQDALKSRCSPRTKDFYALKNPLAGLLVCKKCGKSLVRHSNRGQVFIECINPNCDNSRCHFDRVEQKVIEFISLWLKDDKLVLPESDINKELEFKENALNNKKNNLLKLNSKLNRIYDLLEDGLYDRNTFANRTKKTNEEIETTFKEIEELEQEISALKNIENNNKVFIPTLKYVIEKYNKTKDIEQKNKLLKSVIEKIYYLKEEQGSKTKEAQFELWIIPRINGHISLHP